MHTTELGLLDAICKNPEDDTPRLIYTDWLEERGEPGDVERANFIRSQLQLASCNIAIWESSLFAYASGGSILVQKKQLSPYMQVKDHLSCNNVVHEIESISYGNNSENIEIKYGPAIDRLPFYIDGVIRKSLLGVAANSITSKFPLTGVEEVFYRRGFIEEISGPLGMLLLRLPNLMTEYPLNRVTVTNRQPINRQTSALAELTGFRTDVPVYRWVSERCYDGGYLSMSHFFIPEDIFLRLPPDMNKKTGAENTGLDYETLDVAYKALSDAIFSFIREGVHS